MSTGGFEPRLLHAIRSAAGYQGAKNFSKVFFFGMCPGSQKSSIHWLYIAKILGHLLLRMCFQLDGMDLYIKKGKFQGTDF